MRASPTSPSSSDRPHQARSQQRPSFGYPETASYPSRPRHHFGRLETSNWETLWIALAGGAVGSIVTALIAYGVRFWAARSEVTEHDRLARERDEDLEAWVSDRSIVLRRELEEITEWHNQPERNLFHSGAHAAALAQAKEKALHEYRDQERQARRDVSRLRAAEGLFHTFWRRWQRLDRPQLTAHHRVQPALDYWRSSITRHGDSPVEVRDPTRETFQSTLTEIQLSSRDFV
jgi:hypothetical protein